MMSQLVKLREDHAKLARMFRELGDIISRSAPPGAADLFDFRHELMATVIAHLKLEDWALYPRLIDSGDSETAATGRRFQEEMGGLAPAFLDYCTKWTANVIRADWNGYCRETRALLDALMERLTRENRELLPLLDRVDRAA